MAKLIDKELASLQETMPDSEWVLEQDWQRKGDATSNEHVEVKVYRDTTGKFTNSEGDPLARFERAELVDGVPVHHMDPQ